ncbi:hypothetical protein PJW08_03160 [Tenacibaculum finnmarkense]|nr:hypothetical protein PJW08_03160 [Tenacibaculum finnmarkense]
MRIYQAVSDSLKIGYSQNKMRWAESNEAQIWKYFIEKNMLYNTDKELDIRFLDIAPFSKFYLEKDRQSPGRIGEFIGWQIVRSYMQKNDVSLPNYYKKMKRKSSGNQTINQRNNGDRAHF